MNDTTFVSRSQQALAASKSKKLNEDYRDRNCLAASEMTRLPRE
jgi:hypothetical protein